MMIANIKKRRGFYPGQKAISLAAILLLLSYHSTGQSLEPGTIANGDQVIAYNTYPGFLTASPASGGACSGSYIYQWQESADNITFTNVTGAILANIQLYFPLTTTKYYRRAVTCYTTTAYTPSVRIKVVEQDNSDNRNFIREISIAREGVKIWENIEDLTIGEKFVSTTYLDGLGRAIQSVEAGTSPVSGGGWKDLVKPFEYLGAARTGKDYLPFASSDNPGKFKENAITAQTSYLQAFFGMDAVGSRTFAEVKYDESPLNIAEKTYMPGTAWQNTPVSGIADFNIADEEVHIWTIAYGSNALPETSPTAIYETGTLIRQVAKDEQEHQVITYTDRNGNLVLKKVQENYQSGLTLQHSGWVCTYYVYDDFNQLRFTIPAKLVTYLDENDWLLTQELVDELCFQYEYDEKGRVVKTKVPGKGLEYTVYDQRNRPVFSQDANQRADNKWLAVLYDELNRPVITGIITYSGSIDDLQELVDAQTTPASVPQQGPPVDLFFDTENTGGTHQAIRSITLLDGFESDEEFIAEITPGSGGAYGEITIIEGVEVHMSPLPPAAPWTMLTVTYNDNYEYAGAKEFATTYTLAYTTGMDAVTQTVRTTGMVTGEKVRVLDGDSNEGNDQFLITSVYYDEKGRQQQVLADNIKRGLDYTVTQYDFSGKAMSEFNSHTQAGTTFTTITKHEYDRTGRLLKLYKNYNNSFYKELAAYSYDELGQLKIKKLAPGYEGTQLEQLTYDYNIQGWLTGINKDYALGNTNSSQWDSYFGIYLGYENSDSRFTEAQYDGKLSGLIWRSQGDNSPRKFDFSYDRLGRFTQASFSQRKKPGDSNWSDQDFNFSESVSYADANGNISSLMRYGAIPGQATPQLIDNLQYTYTAIGVTGITDNKLKKVDDLAGLGSNDGLLADFKDVAASEDYVYDENGNLVKDLNKGIKNASANGIIYNYLNKPQRIIIEGKSVVDFVYDAAGVKLQKKVTYADNTTRITTYISGFVYEQFNPSGGPVADEKLLYVQHEEGRLKIITPHTPVADIDFELDAGSSGVLNLPGDQQGVFEYFIMDHLGSTRMVLTEEVQKEYYSATMESAAAAIEERFFGQVDEHGVPTAANEMSLTRENTPGAWTDNSTDQVVKLTALSPNKVIGPNMVLRVMAGDVINAHTEYFFAANSNSGAGNPLNTIATAFINSMSGAQASAIGKNQAMAIGEGLTNSGDFISFINRTGDVAASPKAYLNIVFLDEQFQFIEGDAGDPNLGSGFSRVKPGDAGVKGDLHFYKKAPQNGWAFVYLSNSSDESVYFDNLLVMHEHGRIAEETHYYPFGLKIAAISGRAFNKLANSFNFQGDFAEHEEQTGYDEFDLRMYDPQIARWTGIDPYDEFASPYIGMGNNPVSLTDPTGGSVFGDLFSGSLASRTFQGVLLGGLLGAAVAILGDDVNNIEQYMAWGALAGGGLTYALSSPTLINVQFVPNWGQVKGDIKDHSLFRSPYLAAKLRSFLNEFLSLGKIVTITGDGFVKGQTYELNGETKVSQGQLSSRLNRYFEKHPNAKGVANALTEFHSDVMGDAPNVGAAQFSDISQHFNERSTFMYGNCFQYEVTDATSVALNGATVIGSYNQQLDLPYLFRGKLSGNPLLAKEEYVVAPGQTLHENFLRHRVSQKGMIYDGPATTKVSFSGRISYRAVSDRMARKMNDVYFRLQGKVFRNIVSLIIRGY